MVMIGDGRVASDETPESVLYSDYRAVFPFVNVMLIVIIVAFRGLDISCLEGNLIQTIMM